jgi:hypothetical protein
MMCNPPTPSAGACSTDADRDGSDESAHLPEWVVHLIALFIHCMLRRMLAARLRHASLPTWWHDRPDLPLASAQSEAASVRGHFGNSIRWMCIRRGIGPGHPDWPELSRAIVAFGGSLKGFRAGARATGLQWWENSRRHTGDGRRHPGNAGSHGTGVDAVAPGGCRCAIAGTQDHRAFRGRDCASARVPAAGLRTYHHRSADRAARCLGAPILLCLNDRGQSMAGPAVLIRAERKFPFIEPDSAFRPAAPVSPPFTLRPRADTTP